MTPRTRARTSARAPGAGFGCLEVPDPDRGGRIGTNDSERSMNTRATLRRIGVATAMGMHRRCELKRLLFGSTAERVVASGPCPVLTVRRELA